MGLQLCYVIVGMLILFAIFDLMVGVTNDAVNFLNSAIGSKVAPFFIIMIVASLGILAGVTFSGGMMEVARKGIFHPQFFTMPELLTIFLAVMITDILLLDLFNTHGLPTSTTVSIVFELLGAAVAMSIIKIMAASNSTMALWDYINTAKALAIVGGILLSIVIAFFAGALMQFLSRLIFTFDYQSRLKKYGALWGGMAMTAITFFILVKGSKGATFMDAGTIIWIKGHSVIIMSGIFIVSAFIFQILISLFKINILKPIVLIGTFALAMAFAANDLVNFIGVPLAGLNAFQNAIASSDPLNITMTALSKKVHSQTYIMLIAGLIMVITLWLSKKARTVTETEIRLGQQDEGTEKFESIWLSRKIVNMFGSTFDIINNLTPEIFRKTISRRLAPVVESKKISSVERPSFDLIRASVNLMVASAVVSFATSLKLPLSTTYVTFMVAMGTSFSDRAWGRESAVYRVTGVLAVIGGWFMTAFIAFVVSFIFANILFYLKIYGFFILLSFAGYMIVKNHQKHKKQENDKEEMSIYTLHNVKNFTESLSQTFDHLAFLLKGIRESFDVTFDSLFEEDLYKLRQERMRVKHFQNSTNIIIANIFKVLRLRSKEGQEVSYNFYQIIRRLQKLTDGHRDTVIRSSMHVSNHHKGLLDVQIAELKEIKTVFLNIFSLVETAFRDKEIVDCQEAVKQFHYLSELVDEFNENQVGRIRDDSSKTRLSILFYAISGNCVMMAKQNVKLLDIFNESFKLNQDCRI
ncbi:MAG: inorganic phosphate transporter [Deltaproteobacteria bacterium]|uniref:inorganic phosphate transporter n=1 Tax=Desulfobacula sp. TaxID=2593537 RepID=UPI0019BE4936|nr:inorganic phosphate transporter [Candidatus Desulfobacula maris]MBL6993852.1 inorganic phosphate transporter [Desulfobacula sp.]